MRNDYNLEKYRKLKEKKRVDAVSVEYFCMSCKRNEQKRHYNVKFTDLNHPLDLFCYNCGQLLLRTDITEVVESIEDLANVYKDIVEFSNC